MHADAQCLRRRPVPKGITSSMYFWPLPSPGGGQGKVACIICSPACNGNKDPANTAATSGLKIVVDRVDGDGEVLPWKCLLSSDALAYL